MTTETRNENKALKLVGQVFLLLFSLGIVGSALFALLMPILGSSAPALLWIIPVIASLGVFWKARNIRMTLPKFLGLAILAVLAVTLSNLWVSKQIAATSSEQAPSQ